MRLVPTSLALALLLAAPAPSLASGLAVEPGLWEFTSSIPDPISGEAIRQVHRTCVRERTITPKLVMARMKECRIWNALFQGPSARWKMSCETPLGPMAGRGSLRTTGTAVSGSVDLSMAVVGGFEIPATGTFKGRRVGNCR